MSTETTSRTLTRLHYPKKISTPTVIALALSPTHNFSKTLLPSLNLLPGLGIEGDCHCGSTVQHRSRLHIRPAPPNLRQVHLLHSEFFSDVSVQLSASPSRHKFHLKRWAFLFSLLCALAAASAALILRSQNIFSTYSSVPLLLLLLVVGASIVSPTTPQLLVWFPQRRTKNEYRDTVEEVERHVVNPGDLGENVTTRGIDLLGLGEGTELLFVNPGSTEEKEERRKERPTVRITGLRNPCPQIDAFSKGLRERCLVRGEGREVVGRKAGIMGVVVVGGEVKVGAAIEVRVPEGERKELVCV